MYVYMYCVYVLMYIYKNVYINKCKSENINLKNYLSKKKETYIHIKLLFALK